MHDPTLRQGMLSVVDEDGVLANYNGMKFRLNDVVDVMVGTRVGVRGNKTEPIKARFKGVVETVRGVEFLCRPLVGSGKGRCPEFPRDSVFKVSAFGACVLGTRTTRFFSKLQPTQQDRYIVYDLRLFETVLSLAHVSVLHFCVFVRVMQRANAGLHESYVKVVKEVQKTKKILCEVTQKSEEKCQKAIARVKVRCPYYLCC